MNKEISQKIDMELYREIISPIEVFIKEKMTVGEEFLAMEFCYPYIEKSLITFSNDNNISIGVLISEIKYRIENIEGETKKNCKKQFELVTKILDNLLKKMEQNQENVK